MTRHGTYSGWAVHQKNGERPCDPCYRAKQKYDKRRRAAPIETRKNRAHARAQGRAHVRLVNAHLEEYREYYREEKYKIYKDEGLG